MPSTVEGKVGNSAPLVGPLSSNVQSSGFSLQHCVLTHGNLQSPHLESRGRRGQRHIANTKPAWAIGLL